MRSFLAAFIAVILTFSPLSALADSKYTTQLIVTPQGAANPNGILIGNASTGGGSQYSRHATIIGCNAGSTGYAGTIESLDDQGVSYKRCVDQSGNMGISGSLGIPLNGIIGNNQAVNNQLFIGTANQNTFLREYRTSGGATEMATGGCASSGIWCLNNFGGTGNLITVDASGNVVALNNLTVGGITTSTGVLNGTSAIVAGSATAPSPIAGDLEGSRSTTTGALRLGGTSSNCILDYGASASTASTIGCQFRSTSAITAGSATAPTGPAAGDLQASRSTTTGAITLGGSSSSAAIDFNINNAGGLTAGAAFYAPSEVVTGAGSFGGVLAANGGLTGTTGAFSSTVTSPSISKVYFNGSQITAPLIESLIGTTVVGTTTVSLSAPWTVAPQCTGTVSNGTAGHSIAIGATNTSVVQIADGAVDTFNLTCVGH